MNPIKNDIITTVHGNILLVIGAVHGEPDITEAVLLRSSRRADDIGAHLIVTNSNIVQRARRRDIRRYAWSLTPKWT
jgi:hypothetical protein